MFRVLLLTALVAAVAAAAPLGEFQECDLTGEYVLDASQCGSCLAGQYLCPSDQKTCVLLEDDWVAACPGLQGSHLDPTLLLDERLDALLKAANVDEKISQMTNNAPAILRLGIPAYNYLNDDEHGVKQPHATSFPNGNTLGATFSKAMLREVGAAVGVEARGLHNGFVHAGNRATDGVNGLGITLYAPNLNLVFLPTWGRSQEVYSEDPALTSGLTVEFVTGLQRGSADAPSSPYLLTAANCKHFAVYNLESIPELRYTFSANVTVRDMWETFMPAFDACVVEGEGASVMCSYNAINGVPTCGDPNLLNGILRERFGFEGFVVSDYDAWLNLLITHKYVANLTQAAQVGLLAGMDQEGGGDTVVKAMPQALSEGLVTESDINAAVRRLFRVRIQLGMLDPPGLVAYNMITNGTEYVEGPVHLQLARQAAREGTVLLKNANGALPLDPRKIGKVLLVGPQVVLTDLLQGNYAVPPDGGVASIVQGVYEALGETMPSNCSVAANVDFYQLGQLGQSCTNDTRCCELCSVDPTCNYWTYYAGRCYRKRTDDGKVASPGRISGAACGGARNTGRIVYSPGCDTVECNSTAGFADAVALAKNATDAVIVAVGLDQTLESEGHDRSKLRLNPNVYDLVHQLAAAKPKVAPLVVLLIRGGTIELGSIVDDADAIVDAGYPGQEGGRAIADVLFGYYNPAGRVAVTYYADETQLPAPGTESPYPGATNGSRGVTYRYFEGNVTFPFGHGLSYTTFAYSDLKLNASSISACDSVGLQVAVTNNSTLDGDEVVQLYATMPHASVPVPNIRLVDFERVHVPAGGEVVVNLTVAPKWHSVVYDGSDIYKPEIVVESGDFDLFVGGSQPGYGSGHLHASVTVKNTKDLSTC